ncbi:post-transcriptional regulator [Alkalihalobacillus sp. AL-G]|uniref:post-transcriptional regulator n=1 Tax=Alkalihalobacillus sp. AL-G TaxID=2926399 RepID=UPI00272AE9A6|nr:post-transcriptional regulator [Alkalihalobacillus sp. AL-G]WLD92213.1 post-transcriptional regulator [Alkalihalobacillus sp. AL-G]
MSVAKPLDEWKKEVGPAIKSKKEELHFMGYESVTDEEIWKCIVSRAKKRRDEEWMLHQVVNSVLTLSTQDFMNWLTVQAVTNDSWFPLDSKA